MSSSGSNRSGDPGWKYGYNLNPNDKNCIRCNFCEKDTKEGINRFKKHLVGIKGDVALCKNVPEVIREDVKQYMSFVKQK
ncbi:hypothetical protein AMTRI_Chr04g180190 [Amborella trichopoda]